MNFNLIKMFYVLLSALKRGVNEVSSSIIPNNLAKIQQRANQVIESQYIRTINNEHTFGEKDVDSFLRENEFIKNKRIISVSPGGFKGFYMLGIVKYIKQHYKLDNYIFTGASAGAWNSLLFCFRRDLSEIECDIKEMNLQNTKSISEMEYLIKYKLLSKYKTEDFDLKRLFIGVTTVSAYKTNTTIFSGFDSLDDAINCCIASSHIPLITGGLTNVYRNMYSFDGGFSKYPYLNISRSALHITPSLWKLPKAGAPKSLSISDYTTLFTKDKYNFNDLIKIGYEDAEKNQAYLDERIGKNQ